MSHDIRMECLRCTIRRLLFIIYIRYPLDCIMSECFGYGDAFRLIGTNTITLGKDPHRINRLCQKNFMNLEIKHWLLFSPNKNMNIKLNNYRMVTDTTEKNLRMMVSDDLDCHAQSQICLAESSWAFYKVRSNVSQKTPWYSKLTFNRR